jgi:hypothetical protein
MAGAALPLAILSGGVQAFGAIAGAKAEERQLEAQARGARMQADQADTVYRQDMMRQISNIKAIRASSGMETAGPTFDAIIGDERATAGANRRRKVAGYNMQASQAEADASQVGRLGFIRALGGFVSALG